MTFSIVATDGAATGVAVASKFLAVGNFVPEVRLGAGAVATQASGRWAYRAELLDALALGTAAPAAIERAVAADEGRDHRQLGLVGRDSQATFTGPECLPWAGGVAGERDADRWAIQGNILTGPEVVEAMQVAWLGSTGQSLPRRLLAALRAGDLAGGDRRGRQGAALLVGQLGRGYDASGVLTDLRVDDHTDPVAELARLLDLDELYAGPAQDVAPLTGALAQEVAGLLGRLGHHEGPLEQDLATWAGIENYEMRLVEGGIDARVLAALRASADAS